MARMELAESQEYEHFQKVVKKVHATLGRAATTVSELALAAIIQDKKIVVHAKKQKILGRLSKIEGWEESFGVTIREKLQSTILDSALAVINK